MATKDEINKKKTKSLRMLEFFSGIGGMRLAIEKALEDEDDVREDELRVVVCAAYDISLQANQTYAHNFKTDSAITTKLVEQLKAVDVDGKADLWTMSPPCQPFTNTRGAKKLDANDKRCEGLKGIMRLLSAIENKPRSLLLENVKGFVESEMRSQWLRCIAANGYSWQEVLLSPIQLGVPNHRLRYFIMCERSDRFSTTSTMNADAIKRSIYPLDNGSPVERRPVSDYLDLESLPTHQERDRFLVPKSALEQEWAKDLGISHPSDTETYCFTAGYGRIFHKATGSLLLITSDSTTGDGVDDTSTNDRSSSDMLKYHGRLRRFTPKELLRIFGFPPEFEFPATLSLDHQYKLIGNSVSVTVLALVFRELLLR